MSSLLYAEGSAIVEPTVLIGQTAIGQLPLCSVVFDLAVLHLESTLYHCLALWLSASHQALDTAWPNHTLN